MLKRRGWHFGFWLLKTAGLALGVSLAVFGWRATADAVVSGFNAKNSISPGWVVALSQGSSDTVELAPAGDPSRAYGVVIDPSQAPLTVNKENRQVFVANSGSYPVLVSNQKGEIKSGDYLSMSSTDGIAAKASFSESFILGRAQEPFDNASSAIIRTADGSAVGKIMVQINPGRNPLLKGDTAVPGALRRVGEAVAGKSISAIRLYLALTIFILSAIISGVLLWSGIRNAMVAIGRNPLSRPAIQRGLAQVIVSAVMVFIIGLFAIYLLLKL